MRSVFAAVVGATVAVGIGAMIGNIWFESRPFVIGHFVLLISHSAYASFPSDHLLALGGIAGALWFRVRWLSVIESLIAAMTAFARVFAGMHYFRDISIGFAIGLICGLLAWHVSALKSLKRLGRKDRERIEKAIALLPGTGDRKRLAGAVGIWRLRVGDWRVRYRLDSGRRVVDVLAVNSRGMPTNISANRASLIPEPHSGREKCPNHARQWQFQTTFYA